LRGAVAADDWLAEHPPTFEWGTPVHAMQIDEDHPLLAIALDSAAAVGRPGGVSGLDSWYDGATFTAWADTPSFGFGPRDISAGHTIDEYVPVEDLVPCAQALALMAMRWCGTLP
jgi:acetylornithine deacetylase